MAPTGPHPRAGKPVPEAGGGRVKSLRAIATLALLLGTYLLVPNDAHANGPGECIRYSPLHYCIEWDDGNPGSPGNSGGNGGGGPAPTCYWVTIPDIDDDPAIYADFDLQVPPPGAEIIWQSWECSDGTVTFNFRWIFEPTPGDVATEVRARIEGQLPAPVVTASPALGTASIIGVPTFVAVANWNGAVTDSGCAGAICVTVTATPSLRFTPGEPGATAVACSGAGTTFNRSIPPKDQAAIAGACAHIYRSRTGVNGRPAEWPGSVSVSWSISWQANNGQTGVLPSITPFHRTAPRRARSPNRRRRRFHTMSTVLRRTDPPKINGDIAQRARAAAISSSKQARPAVRRRWTRIGAGITLTVFGAWVAAALYLSAGERTEVVVLANPVSRFDTIDRLDLRVTRISADAESWPLSPATQLDSLIGRVAAADLTAGSLLTNGDLLPPGEKLLKADEAIAGVLLGPGDGQMNLARGTPVLIVVRPSAGATAVPIEIQGWVYDASSEALNSRERPVELAVPKAQAGLISAAAAEKRVTIVALGE